MIQLHKGDGEQLLHCVPVMIFVALSLQIIYLSVVHDFTEDFSKQSLQLEVHKHVFVFSSDSMGQTPKLATPHM
jgi:hypothetical protein